MPKYGPSQIFKPLTLPDHVIASMPDPVAEAWGQFQAAVQSWTLAQSKAAKAQTTASNAVEHDKQAAQHAVDNHQKIPPSTAGKMRVAAEQAQREVEPRRRIAGQAEQAYLAVAATHRDEWTDSARSHAVSAASDALHTVETAQQIAAEASEAFGLWQWLAYTDTLHRGPVTPKVPGLTEARMFMLSNLDPSVIDAVVAAERADQEQLREEWKVRGLGAPPVGVAR